MVKPLTTHGGLLNQQKRWVEDFSTGSHPVALYNVKNNTDALLNMVNPKYIIPEDSQNDWVRGGLPTRQMIRNADYLRRCQEKTMPSN